MKEDKLRIFCSNVRGLVCNWGAATSFNWDNYDLVAFNEIWGIKDFETLAVNNFEIKTNKQRTNRRGGGTIIFGRDSLECVEIDTPFVEGCIETTGVKIGDVYFLNIYRPPSGDKDQFIELLLEFMNTKRGNKVIIGGDFNVNYLLNSDWYTNLCQEIGLEAKINDITRVVSSTCIDNFLTNIQGRFLVSDVCIADHQAIIADVIIHAKPTKLKSKFSYRQMKDANFALFNHKVYNENLVQGNTIDEKWNSLQNSVHTIINECFPLKTSNRRYIFTMSQGLLKSRDKKNKLLRQYKQGRIDKSVYVNYNKIYRKLIKTEQSEIFNDKLKSAGIDGKKKWKVIKQHLLLDNKKHEIEALNINGNLITSKIEIAEAFRHHFETCANKLAENLPQGHDTSDIMQTGPTWSFNHTTSTDLLKIIQTLKNKNSAGLDCLSNRMLKKEAYRFSVILAPLINESIDQGIFPDCLKQANLIPIFKKGDPTDPNNYRPIALLPVLSKVFEKVLNLQITKIIDSGFVDDNQFGFRQGYSTEDAALKFVNQIQKELN